MPTDTAQSAPPGTEKPPAPGPRERAALAMIRLMQAGNGPALAALDPAEQMLCWLAAELGRQGDVLDRLTALLPAAERAARLMSNPAAAAVVKAAGRRSGRAGRGAASVDLKGS